ncbi:MAG: alanine racemase [Rickettsiales bacterium]|nr:alanine racemase [Rickettsiales bacterium]
MNVTWLEISRSALLNNIKEIKKNISSKTKFIAVVKANAYGHGLLEVANIIKNNVDSFAVFDFNDAVFLRQKKITKPLLTLGRLFPEQINLAVKNNIEATITTFDILEKLQKTKLSKKLQVHICVDTGLGRDGFVLSDLEKLLKILQNKNLQKNIEVVGLYAHFASADDSKFDSYTKKQIEIFKKWKNAFAKIGLKPLIHHAASAASLTKKGTDFDAIRIGLSLYGLYPSEEIRAKKQNKLQPVLSWKVKISEVKNMKKGEAISYGCTHILKRDSKIAVLPIGYFDGISRISSNKSFAIVKGKKVPQIGRITMNLIVLDVTDVKDVKIGDVVTIIGKSVSADNWASWAQTSNYEIVTRLGAHLSRKITR